MLAWRWYIPGDAHQGDGHPIIAVIYKQHDVGVDSGLVEVHKIVSQVVHDWLFPTGGLLVQVLLRHDLPEGQLRLQVAGKVGLGVQGLVLMQRCSQLMC